MVPRTLVWLFAVFALRGLMAQTRVVLQLPLAPKDKSYFKVKKSRGRGEYVEYQVSRNRKRFIIREVIFGDMTLFKVSDGCDSRAKDRVVTVTLTGHGIFVQVTTITMYAPYHNFYYVDVDDFYEFIYPDDYSRFVRPLSYRASYGSQPFPYAMVAFVPIFQKRIEVPRKYICSESDVNKIMEKEDELVEAQKPNSMYFILEVKRVKRLFFTAPKEKDIAHSKRIYKRVMAANISKRRFTHILPLLFNRVFDDDLCKTAKDSVKTFIFNARSGRVDY